MGVTKSEIFSSEQNQIANYAKVLGHPARISILQHLMTLNQCVCGDLVGEIGLAQATISQHLRELKNMGIIQGTIDGTRVCYCINQEVWEEMRNTFESFFAHKNNNINHCK